MAYWLELQYVGVLAISFCLWLWSTVKRFHKQANKKNNRIPDISTLKKITPLTSCHGGWKVKAVHNAVPVWSYGTTFTFAPKNLVSSCVALRGKPAQILEELKRTKVFSMIFPHFPTFRSKHRINTGADGDVLVLSNIFPTLSIPNIVLTEKKTEFTFERKWSSSANMCWLYVAPSVELLTSKYGYWFCFLLQDMECESSSNNTTLLHILASFPGNFASDTINQAISSCQVLLKNHLKSLVQENNKPMLRLVGNDSIRVKKEGPKTSTTPAQRSEAVGKRYSRSTSSKEQILADSESDEDMGAVKRMGAVRVQRSTQLPKVDSKVQFETNSPVKSHMSSASKHILSDAGDTRRNTSEKAECKQKPSKQVTKSKKPAMAAYPKVQPYLEVIKEGYNMLMSIWEADENTEGWSLFNNKDGVVVHRKDPTGDIPDIYKGKTTIKVPLPYLIHYLKDLQYKPEFDDMFEDGGVIEDLGDNLTTVVNLVYKNIWPVSGRDFCSISAMRHIKDNLYGTMVKAITHQDCPPIKSKVRGEVIIGGYIYEEVSKDPPVVNVMFATCANMSGSIPQRVVNKVSSDQPLSLSVVRKKVEERFRKRDPDVDGEEQFAKFRLIPSVYQKEDDAEITDETTVDDGEEESQLGSSVTETIVTETVVAAVEETCMEADIRKAIILESDNKSESREGVITEADPGTTHNGVADKNLIITKADIHYPHQSSVDTTSSSSSSLELNTGKRFRRSSGSEEDILSAESDTDEYDNYSDNDSDNSSTHPRDSSGEIDFVTLGDQCLAGLEEELFAAQKVDTTGKHQDRSPRQNDVWMYRGTSKNVIIMKKTSTKQSIQSFLGRGIINALPTTVWQQIKNPATRFVYDSMLKSTSVIKELDERSKIVYLRHETHACLVKQARDFCLMTVETMNKQRYAYSAVSVDVPECPTPSDCVRGRVFSSGWIIEPFVQNGKTVSVVTYITQIDFGGRLPNRLVNFISKRQPLAIAYLRSHMEAMDRKSSGMSTTL